MVAESASPECSSAKSGWQPLRLAMPWSVPQPSRMLDRPEQHVTQSRANYSSSLMALSRSSRSKRTKASSGPSCAPEKACVAPIRVRHAPVSRADS